MSDLNKSEKIKGGTGDGIPASPEINFVNFISGLTAEGLAAAGLLTIKGLENIEKNLNHTRLIIDTMSMLSEKTKGNLSEEEAKRIEESLHHLRIVYVAETEKKTKGSESEA